MNNKRMIGNYTVLNSMYIGHREIAFCENPNAAKDERYLCCYIENVAVIEHYTEAVVSDGFAEIAKIFGERIAAAAEEIIKEIEEADDQVGQNSEITSSECIPVTWEDSIENKIVVIKGDNLRPEFRRSSYQLMLCTGGFGSQPNARARTCHCISLFNGKSMSYYRSDILGVIEPEDLPEWAKKGLEKAKEVQKQEKRSLYRSLLSHTTLL